MTAQFKIGDLVWSDFLKHTLVLITEIRDGPLDLRGNTHFIGKGLIMWTQHHWSSQNLYLGDLRFVYLFKPNERKSKKWEKQK